jgi:hypothetical protein
MAREQVSLNSEGFVLQNCLPDGTMPPSTAGSGAYHHISRQALTTFLQTFHAWLTTVFPRPARFSHE